MNSRDCLSILQAMRRNVAPRVSFQRPRNDEERTYESKRLTHDLALGPDVTFEDRFMNIGTYLHGKNSR